MSQMSAARWHSHSLADDHTADDRSLSRGQPITEPRYWPTGGTCTPHSHTALPASTGTRPNETNLYWLWTQCALVVGYILTRHNFKASIFVEFGSNMFPSRPSLVFLNPPPDRTVSRPGMSELVLIWGRLTQIGQIWDFSRSGISNQWIWSRWAPLN